MKLYYRNTIFWNQVYFIILSVVGLFMTRSISSSKSSLNLLRFENFLTEHIYLVVLGGALSFLVFHNKKVSKLFYIIFYTLILLLAVTDLYYHFSKISVVLISFHAGLIYYFYQLLKLELNKASYNPRVGGNELRTSILKDLNISFQYSSEEVVGTLLNWDEHGFTCKLNRELDIFNKEIEVHSSLENYKLKSLGRIVSYDKKNKILGVDFGKEEKSELNWDTFFGIMKQYGLTMEYLK